MYSQGSIVAPSTGTLSKLPLEIRRMIYKEIWAPKMNMHLYFQGDRLSALPCLGANMGDEKNLDTRYPSKEECDLRWEKKPSKSDNFWLTRLSSSWGNHYRCEEDWMPHPEHPSHEKNCSISTLLACKQMYAECLDIIHESLEVHISDLETAIYLVGGDSPSPKSTTSDHPQHVIPKSIIQSARTVNLTFFQPPEFYVALDVWDKVPKDWQPEDAELNKFKLGTLWKDLLNENLPKAPLWAQVWSGLAALPRLLNVNLWMDHNQPQSWSYVSERAVLEPIRQAAWSPSVKLAVHLPNLCHDRVSPEAHFNQDESLPFQIQRRYRCPTRPERDWWGCSYEPDISDEEMAELGNEYGADLADQQWTAVTVIVSELENRCYKAVDITTRLPEMVRKTFSNTQARLGYGK